MLVDEITLDYLHSSAPDPTQESLDAVLRKTGRVRVFGGGAIGGKPLTHDTLIDTGDPDSIAALKVALRIVDGGDDHCMCVGDPTIELLDNRSRRLAIISSHHGHDIRWNVWKDDARLIDGRSLLQWLADRNVAYPLEEYEEAARQGVEAEAEWQRRVEAMPPAVRPFADQNRNFVGERTNLSPIRSALVGAYPDSALCARALFAWFGSGAGPWSIFPAYETFAEEMLMEIPMGELLRALDMPELTAPELEGAARLFAGWGFHERREADLTSLPAPAKARLLAHIRQSTDVDKQSRARRVFAI
jgi:hypothetical protein